LGAQVGGPSHYLRTKAAGEAVLKALPLSLTVLRPSVIFGAEDRFLNLFAQLARRLPLLPLAAAEAQLQPVWVDDVARAIAICLDRPDTVGQTIECAGPRAMTLRALVEAVGRWSGHPPRVLPISDGLARLQIAMLSLLPGEPLMTADNLLSLRVPNVAGGDLPTLRQLGIDPAPLEAVAPLILGSQLQARLTRWRAAARKG
jgi:NADH dehydrogenase